MNSSLRKQVDKMLDAYVDWHEACLLESDGYRNWSSATGPDVTAAFVGYMTALDREERAAEIYARLVRRVGDLATGEHNPAGTLGALAWRAHRR
jgi:hypothetical protein